MSSFTTMTALLSVALMSISLTYLSSSADPIDCTRWIAEANSIIPHSQSNWAHTFVDADGSMYANEQFPEEEKDACTRSLHSKLKRKSRRLDDSYASEDEKWKSRRLHDYSYSEIVQQEEQQTTADMTYSYYCANGKPKKSNGMYYIQGANGNSQQINCEICPRCTCEAESGYQKLNCAV